MKEVLGVKLYTLDEVGELLGVRRATVTKYVQQGKLQARTIGGYKYVTEENLKEFLHNND